MSITAKDIQEQGFEHSRKGYDVEEVDVFLERVAVEVDALTRQNQELRTRVTELSDKVTAAEAAATEAASALETAQAEASAAVAAKEAELSDSEKGDYEARIDDLLAQVADLERKSVESKRKIDSLEADLARKGEDESAISAAIISAQKSADNIRAEARIEGEKIYKEAESKARELVRDALSEKQKTLIELEQLKKSRNDFQSEYKEMLVRFGAVAEKEFVDGIIDGDDDADAAEKGAMAEVRSHAAAYSADDIDALRQEAMPMPGTQTAAPEAPVSQAEAVPAPSANIAADLGAFGDTEEFDAGDLD